MPDSGSSSDYSVPHSSWNEQPTREGPLPSGSGPSWSCLTVPYLTGPMETELDSFGAIANFTDSVLPLLFLENFRSHENLPP